jgi:ubiquinone/menaquinone biosynthesis C-methylase UbiE
MDFKYLNLGGGYFQHRDHGWGNLDYPFEKYSYKRDPENFDIVHNLMSPDPIPVNSNVLEIVYCSHTIEHLTEDRAQHLFNEAYRMLISGGYFRVAAPDSYLLYDYLVNPQNHELKLVDLWNEKYCKTDCQRFLDAVCTPLIEIVSDDKLREMYKTKSKKAFFAELQGMIPSKNINDQEDRPGNHLSWWHSTKIEVFMRNAGFTMISSSLGQNESSHKALRESYIDDTCPQCSVRMEAIK